MKTRLSLHLKNNIIVIVLLFSLANGCQVQKFEPTVESLQENYQTPEWFNDAKFGIWVCWNAYTVPAVGDWYARNMYIEGHDHYNYHVENYGHPSEYGYKDIIQLWKGEKFDAKALTDLFVETGAKYIIAMANHHDNFDLWDSKHHSWNSVNYGPKRDIMAEFREAVLSYKDQGIRWGMTSHLERTSSWFQTNKGADTTGVYKGIPYDGNDQKYVELYLPPDPMGDNNRAQPINAPEYWRQEWLARCKDLIDSYQPDFFYVDGGVPFPGDDKGQSGLEMISYLYKQNASWHNGKNEAVMCIKDWTERFPNGEWGFYWDGIATLNLERRKLADIRKEPWQTDTSIGRWTYVKGAKYRSATTIIQELVSNVSKNGNVLLNVSPMSNGELDPAAYKLLKEIGSWMKINGESIYESRPWYAFGVDDIRIVKKGSDKIYATSFEWPESGKLTIPLLIPEGEKIPKIKAVSLLGLSESIKWKTLEGKVFVELPNEKPCDHAWVFKIEI